ncbi:MAG: alpha/beta hydrolase [Burkholderiales bacterium]|nr:alpha/beta hydrolase [Burkholderiales bacterium]
MPPRSSGSSTPAVPQDDTITCADGCRVALRRYAGERHQDRHPERPHDGTPLVLHFHAGAFVGGTLDDGAVVATLLADAGARVLSIDYPLAPAHPFPQAVEAGYRALTWAEQHRRELAAARAPLFVAGEEAGGNLAAAVAMVARDRAGPELAGQILLSPMLDACVATASQRHAKAGPVGCRWADGWHRYLAREDDALHPYAVPGRSMRLAGLPRTLLVSAADDPLRDETQAFGQRLRAAGVPVTLALLDAPTGWPLSYQCAAAARAARAAQSAQSAQSAQADPITPTAPTAPAWAAPLGARLHEFLASFRCAQAAHSAHSARSARSTHATPPTTHPRGSHP